MAVTWMTTREAAEFLGVSQPTLSNWRAMGCGPRYVKFGKRKVRYKRNDLVRFMEESLVKGRQTRARRNQRKRCH